MPRREWAIRIDHMITAVEKILSYTYGMDAATFAADERTTRGI